LSNPYIPNTDADRRAMLTAIGVATAEEQPGVVRSAPDGAPLAKGEVK